ncbi:unnamed protein product [Agarophyton chilense]
MCFEPKESRMRTKCKELFKQSPPITLAGAKVSDSRSLGKLSLFHSASLGNKTGVAFVGGHISVLKWHPEVRGVLATAAHRSDQTVHEVLETYSGSAHIQLWSISNNTAICLGVVQHDGDCTWDLKWRPGQYEPISARSWCGTFAAALGDGRIMICRFSNTLRCSSAYDVVSGSANVLPCKKTILREGNERTVHGPARVVEWSLDGKRLLVGSVVGTVEVYESSSSESVWPKWCVPAQESIVTDIRWVNRYLFCSLGVSCVLRLRDIRDPVATLEQNAEGLAGSHSMCIAEPNVAVVGGDSGYLRVVRLYGTDNFRAKYPVRKVYVQGGSFRTMQSVSSPFRGTHQSLVFTGGCEGILHEVSFPRPLWLGYEECSISKTTAKQLLRWSVKRDSRGEHGTNITLQLTIGDSTSEGIHGGEEHASDVNQSGQKGNIRNPKHQRRKKVSGPCANDKPLFGSAYHQSVVITRVDINIHDKIIAVGIDGGIITWLQLQHQILESSLIQTNLPTTRKKRRRTTSNLQEENNEHNQGPSEVKYGEAHIEENNI